MADGRDTRAKPVRRPAPSPSDIILPLRHGFGGSLAVQFVNVATGLLLARELGPHDRGVLLAVMLWPGLLATLAGLGVAEAVAYSVARRQERLGVITGSAIAIGLAQAAVV